MGCEFSVGRIMSDGQIWTQRRSTTIHESGHAVASYLLGRAFVSISIVPTSTTLGVVHQRESGDWFHPDVDAGPRARRLAEQEIMVFLAGVETERAWLRGVAHGPVEPDEHVAAGARHDEECAAELAGYFCGSSNEAAAYVAWLRQRVLNWTGRSSDDRPRVFWPLVEALADSLDRHAPLSWSKARAVLRGSDPQLVRLEQLRRRRLTNSTSRDQRQLDDGIDGP